MSVIIGFTGTRNGMTPEQKKEFKILIRCIHQEYGIKEFHHGDCVGSDEQADSAIYSSLDTAGVTIVGHPGNVPSRSIRAYCNERSGNRIWHEPLPFLYRDRIIVDTCKAIIATPKESEPQPKGGTWYTIGYARKTRKNVMMIHPDGTLEKIEALHP